MNAKQAGDDSSIACLEIRGIVATCWKVVCGRARSNWSNGERGEAIFSIQFVSPSRTKCELWSAVHRSAPKEQRMLNGVHQRVDAYNNTKYSKRFAFISIHFHWNWGRLRLWMKKFVSLLPRHTMTRCSFFAHHKFWMCIRKRWCLLMLCTRLNTHREHLHTNGFYSKFCVCCERQIGWPRPNSNTRSTNQASNRNNSFPFFEEFKAKSNSVPNASKLEAFCLSRAEPCRAMHVHILIIIVLDLHQHSTPNIWNETPENAFAWFSIFVAVCGRSGTC